MERRADGAGYGRAVDVRGKGASAAARLGAIGVVIRSIGTDHNRAAPHGRHDSTSEDAPKIPAAALSVPDAELLERMLARRQRPCGSAFTLGCHDSPDAESANVIGEIPGATKTEEIVLLGAHLDSWDLGTGAIDDGAGCGIVLEAARLIGELPRRPARTIRVVLFANEEHGIDGGKAYREAHIAELPRHVAAFESDTARAARSALQWLAGAVGRAGRCARSRRSWSRSAPAFVAARADRAAPTSRRSAPTAFPSSRSGRTRRATSTATTPPTTRSTRSSRAGMDRNAAAVAAFAWVAASDRTGFREDPRRQTHGDGEELEGRAPSQPRRAATVSFTACTSGCWKPRSSAIRRARWLSTSDSDPSEYTTPQIASTSFRRSSLERLSATSRVKWYRSTLSRRCASAIARRRGAPSPRLPSRCGCGARSARAPRAGSRRPRARSRAAARTPRPPRDRARGPAELGAERPAGREERAQRFDAHRCKTRAFPRRPQRAISGRNPETFPGAERTGRQETDMNRRDLETLLLTLESTPALLARAAEAHLSFGGVTQPADGGFSFVENVWHLADLEREAYGVRIQRIVSEDEPMLSNFDGDRIARERRYQDREVAAGLAAFADSPAPERRSAAAPLDRGVEARCGAGRRRHRDSRRPSADDGRARPFPHGRRRAADRGVLRIGLSARRDMRPRSVSAWA